MTTRRDANRGELRTAVARLPIDAVVDRLKAVITGIYIEHAMERDQAYSKPGRGLSVVGSSNSSPTEAQALPTVVGQPGDPEYRVTPPENRPPREANQKRADHLERWLRDTLVEALFERSWPDRKKAQLPRCEVRGCDDPATRRSPYTRTQHKDRCEACSRWEYDNGQERRTRSVA